MAITLTERFLSPARMSQAANYRKDKFSQNYIVNGDAGETENDIYAYLTANTPATKDTLIRDNIALDREEAEGWWTAQVYYTHPQNSSTQKSPEPGQGIRWTVRSAGGTPVNRLQSEEFIEEAVDSNFTKKWQLSGSTDKIKRLIGWKITPDGSNNVEGLDLPLGGVEIAVQVAVTDAQVTGGFLVTAAGHAANQAVNLNPWNGFAAKTLRLISFQAIPRNDANPAWDITYTFDFSPTVTVKLDDLSLVKQGQHYLDIITEYRPVDADDNFTLPFVIRMATHRIRPEIDYATELGI